MSTAIAKNYLVYEAIKAALEATKDDYPQVFKINRYGKYFTLSCEMLIEQHYSDFFPLAEELSKQLSRIDDAYLDSSVTWNYKARVNNDVFSIALILHCNIMGNKYVDDNVPTLKGAITEENIRELYKAVQEDSAMQRKCGRYYRI